MNKVDSVYCILNNQFPAFLVKSTLQQNIDLDFSMPFFFFNNKRVICFYFLFSLYFTLSKNLVLLPKCVDA